MSNKFFSVLAAVVSIGVTCSSLANASSIYIGNPLVNYGSTDGDPPLVIAGEYTATGPTAASTINFPTTGKVIDVKVYDTSAGNTFTAYVFQPAGTDAHGNQKFTIIDSSGTLTTTKPGGGGVDTFTLATPGTLRPAT
jgi:hypothetical protein